MKLLKLLLCSILVTVPVAKAEQGDVNLTLQTVGHHWASGNFNDLNWGARISYEVIDRVSVNAGAYRNSFPSPHTRTSETVGIGYKVIDDDAYDLSLTYQLSNNYKTRMNPEVKQFILANLCVRVHESTKIAACISQTLWMDGKNIPSALLSFRIPLNY